LSALDGAASGHDLAAKFGARASAQQGHFSKRMSLAEHGNDGAFLA
jgi:hypothetical protein